MATKKTETTLKNSTAKVIFTVKTPYQVENVYICGSDPKLGGWDVKKAILCNYDETKNEYSVSKMLNLDELVEYKVLCGKTWDCVEKGYFKEEIQNRSIKVTKGLNVLNEVANFN